MRLTTSTEDRAERLIARMRETPMRRGALSAQASWTRNAMTELAFKFHRRDLEGVAV